MTLSDTIRPILEGAYKLRDADGRDVSFVFQTLPDRRLTVYYKIIKRPISLYMIKQHISHNRYKTLPQFLHDFAQITFNARVFNQKGSQIYEDAVTLDNYLREQIAKLRESKQFSAEETQYPDLGPLPSSDVEDNNAEHEEEDDDDDEDDDEEEEETKSPPPRRRGRPRRSVTASRKRRQEEEEEQNAVVDDRRKRRGRPPTVDKPHEHRIKAIMRGVRKERDVKTGRILFYAFEKLPDPKQYPEYYQEVAQPISLDHIRKNIKRRKYSNVEMYLADMNLLFNNAKLFNADSSQIYKDAVHLQQVMRGLAEEELKKPDSVYQDPDANSKIARLPLDQFEHRGEIYRVGDWVHLSNLNDPAKPTIGQIFRIWRVGDGQKWVNCCWYYRPEQTVHRYDKLFYENEVVKSGQYRDHLVDEILEKCFVMFFTKYQRGRPSGIGDRSVYCCESRYNEVDKTFNKIRTWKACIPDEIRSTDYPMDLFDRLHPLRRVVSPIKHLLPANAKEDDPIPEPKMGVPSAPPIVGGVYKRPIDPNEPPEQPTPEGEDYEGGPGIAGSPQTIGSPGNPSMLSSRANPQLARGSPMVMAQSTHPVSRPVGRPPLNAVDRAMQGQMVGGSPNLMGSPVAGRGQAQQFPVVPGYFPPAPPSTFTLPDAVQIQLPSKQLGSVAKVRGGNMLWFTSPPLYVSNRIAVDPIQKEIKFRVREGEEEQKVHANKLGHSAKYMAWKLQKLRREVGTIKG